MTEKLNYISDKDLERLILQVEQKEQEKNNGEN